VAGASPRPGLRLAAEIAGLSATAVGDLRELAIAQAQARLDVLDVPVTERRRAGHQPLLDPRFDGSRRAHEAATHMHRPLPSAPVPPPRRPRALTVAVLERPHVR